LSSSVTIGDALKQAVGTLAPCSESARSDAEVLLAAVTGKPRHEPYGFPERHLASPDAERYRCWIERRCAGEPVAYLLGQREFWSLCLRTTPDVLIPRPETELLVQTALNLLAHTQQPRVADLGTGSGAIALALANERPDLRVTAVEVCGAALDVARDNAAALDLRNVEFLQGNWCEPLQGLEGFEMLISNPPYVASNDPHLAQGDLRFEPSLALDGGPDGLAAYRQILGRAHRVLRPGAIMLFEHGYDQGVQVPALLREHGYTDVSSAKDYAGQPRLCFGRWPGTAENC